ncbi:Hsp20/alpha crystallin family protein [Agromyces aurantiacus]|uniref:Hsp20/alpha crystallin family protein n=1 Tax=Agromyces aurantiacus TaxID=165814 RepID=A0ABV9R4B7_9MICO|nr:Hsp20/alpha crystallin family protein [Agromyces aurantiacus]MBM7502971.1 HSP20 family protein [Agromyces aurantiacus]
MARNVIRFDPFAELGALQRQLFPEGMFSQSRRTAPITDIYTEGDDKLTVEAHLPGFGEGDIDVDVDQGALVIQAERHEKDEDKDKKKYVVRESSMSYYRRIELPEMADEESVSADFHNGVLKVTVPYKALPSPRKVSITTSGGAADQTATS